MKRKAFTINIPNENFIRETAYFGAASGNNVNKFEGTGLTPVRSEFVDAPYIEEIPLNIECEVINTMDLGSHIQFIGLIKNVKLDETIDEKRPIIDQLKPIVYASGDNFQYYTIDKKLERADIKGMKMR